jgi:hypothetical protein
MKLPNYEQVMMTREKVVDYLLSNTHRDGRHKDAFFKRFGFAVAEWERAAWALREHAAEHDVTRVETSLDGQRYVMEGGIRSPDGRDPFIRTIWFTETADETPRFVTAYPLGETPMINELDTVVLTTELPAHSLKAGDLGTVVLVHRHGGYEVEFMTLDGETVAVVSLSPDHVRRVGRREIAHARLVTTE